MPRKLFRKARARYRARRAARAAAPQKRSGGMNVNKVVRTVAAVSGGAILLAEPIAQAVYRFREQPETGQAIASATTEFLSRLTAQKPGVYVAAFVPSMAAEVGIQGKNLVGAAGRGIARSLKNW